MAGCWQKLDAFEPGELKDTAGAGDWCTAGIIFQLAKSGVAGLEKTTAGELKHALTYGQALAAWNCRFEGPRGGMYLRDREQFQNDID
jgi:fructokinase